MIRLRKCYLTILEILVVVFILSLGAVLTGIKIRGVYQEQQFLSEANRVMGHLQMAQDLMVVMDTDVIVRIVKNNKSVVQMWVEVAQPLVIRKKNQETQKTVLDPEISAKWAEMIERKISLNAIKSYHFEVVDHYEPAKVDKDNESYLQSLSLRFSFGKMTAGRLILSSNEETSPSDKDSGTVRSLYLPGYPTVLRNQVKVPEFEDKTQESTALFPKFETET